MRICSCKGAGTWYSDCQHICLFFEDKLVILIILSNPFGKLNFFSHTQFLLQKNRNDEDKKSSILNSSLKDPFLCLLMYQHNDWVVSRESYGISFCSRSLLGQWMLKISLLLFHFALHVNRYWSIQVLYNWCFLLWDLHKMLNFMSVYVWFCQCHTWMNILLNISLGSKKLAPCSNTCW